MNLALFVAEVRSSLPVKLDLKFPYVKSNPKSFLTLRLRKKLRVLLVGHWDIQVGLTLELSGGEVVRLERIVRPFLSCIYNSHLAGRF